MSLREELAQRLYAAHWGPTVLLTGRGLAKLDGANLEAWMKAADECIRQMEWARRETPAECGHCGRGEGDPPLTLAPEDWRPE